MSESFNTYALHGLLDRRKQTPIEHIGILACPFITHVSFDPEMGGTNVDLLVIRVIRHLLQYFNIFFLQIKIQF